MKRLTVLDFGMGNLRSVAKALEKVGASVDVAHEVDPRADALVVPGQGAFGSCVLNLGSRLDAVRGWVDEGRPYLGICLGLQVLYATSEEEPGARGAGRFHGAVRRLPAGQKIPHIGWNEVEADAGHPLFRGIDPGTRFYFVHSFAPEPGPETIATTTYGTRFTCAAARDRIMATQFHPEKSGDAGLALLANFLEVAA